MNNKVRMVLALLSVALLVGYMGYRSWYTPTAGDAPVLKAAAPSFELKDQDGTDHTLASVLKKGPALLVFYRGYW